MSVETFAVPEHIAAQPYADKYSSQENTWKQIENLEALAGKKGYIPPSKDATPEEHALFYNKVMTEVFKAPDKAEAYELETVEGFERPEKEDKILKELLFKYRIPASQAKGFIKDYESSMFLEQKEKLAQEAELVKKIEAEDAAFDEMFKKMYGADFNARTEAVKNEIANSLPAELKAMVSGLDAKGLAVATAAIDSILKKYTGEGKFGNAGQSIGNTDNVLEALNKERQTIVANPAFYDFRHVDNVKLKQRVSEIEQLIFDARKKK